MDIKRWNSSTEYDKQLLNINLYKKHPELLPYIGENYSNNRILLVGESHYIQEEQIKEKYRDERVFADEWYSNFEELKRTISDNPLFDWGWAHTRKIATGFMNGRHNGPMYSNPAKCIKEEIEFRIGQPVSERAAYSCLAFMNYFQRPSIRKGKNIEPTEMDIVIAEETFSSVVDILKPSIIIFASKTAFYWYSKTASKINGMVESVVHPSCAWWHSHNDGKQKFKRIIGEYLDSVNPRKAIRGSLCGIGVDTKTVLQKFRDNSMFASALLREKKGAHKFSLNNPIIEVYPTGFCVNLKTDSFWMQMEYSFVDRYIRVMAPSNNRYDWWDPDDLSEPYKAYVNEFEKIVESM